MDDPIGVQRQACVWDALEDTPHAAAIMRTRSRVMIAIQREVRSWGLTQAEAAERLGVTQLRLNDLLRGKIGTFSLDALVDLTSRAGPSVAIDIAKASYARSATQQATTP